MVWPRHGPARVGLPDQPGPPHNRPWPEPSSSSPATPARASKASTPGSGSRRPASRRASRRRASAALNLVIHDFEPGWDTYIEKPGYAAESDLTFDDVRIDDYEAVLVLGGRAPEYLRHDRRVLDIVRGFDAAQKWVFAICHGVQILAAAGPRQGQARHRLRALPLGDPGGWRRLRHGRSGRPRRPRRHRPDLAVAPGVLPARVPVPVLIA